jgi:hypothetical protein
MVSEKWKISICAAVSLVTACALRIPLRPGHLFSEDCINFADAIHRFDPQMWHPQPPGYPLFVLQSKLIHLFVPSVELTFLVGVIIATAIALFMALLLGRDMFGSWAAGVIAAALLLVNPAFIYTGLTSTIRAYVAVVPLVCAYFCWQLWRGKSAYWWAAALALGIGSGYRPQMLLLLFPLWAWSAWHAKRSVREFLAGLALVALSSGVWIYILLSRFQSLAKFWAIITLYLTNQSRNSSPLFSAPVDGWLRMLGFLIAWNGMAVAGWILFRFFAKPRAGRGAAWFLALWIVPAVVFHATIHLAAPDQALITIAAFCVLGGGVLAALLEKSRSAGIAAVGFAVALNLVAFWHPISLYPFVKRVGIEGNLLYMRKQITDGLWEMSWTCFRSVNVPSEQALKTFQQTLAGSPGKTFVIWNRSPVTWRKLAYYYPDQTYCLLHDQLHTDIYTVTAACWQGANFLRRYDGAPVRIPLAGASRIIWVLGESSPAKTALGARLQTVGPGGIYWTPAEPMEVPGYRFVN